MGERSERPLIVALSSVFGLVHWGVVLVTLVATFTFVERAIKAIRALG